MKVLVSDASVLIDLARWSLLAKTLRLPFTFIVPDALFEEELIDLEGIGRPELLRLGLVVEGLGPEEFRRAERLQSEHPKLTVYDCFAISLAVSRGHALLTGDSEMRKLAEQEELEVHGVIWILDQLIETGLDNPAVLAKVLENALKDRRSRLPAAEMRRRIDTWRRSG